MSRTLFSELFASYQSIDVPPTGGLTISDRIDEQVGAVMYRFTAPAKGKIEMVMSGDGSGIDSVLQVFNAKGRRIRRNDNASRGTTDSRIKLGIRPGQVYYVAASSRDRVAGEYNLEFTSTARDEMGNSFETARAMPVTAAGTARAAGRIDYAGDDDLLQFVATSTGRMEMILRAIGRNNNLQGRISAYNEAGQLLSVDAGGVLTVDVVDGQRYYLKIQGANDTVGKYRLRVNPTTPAFLVNAELLDLPAADSVTAEGSLAAGALVSYKITAPARGAIRVSMSGGGGLQSHLLIYDGKGRLVARDVNVYGDSTCNFYAEAGAVYYLVAAAANGTSGDYSMSVRSIPIDDYGNTIDTSDALSMRDDLSGSVYGKIDYSGDVDILSVVAGVNGTMSVTMSAASATTPVNGMLSVYDSAGQLVDSGTGTVTFEVLSGQMYYLQAAGVDGSAGRYRLAVSTEADAVLPPAPPEQQPQPGDSVTGRIESTRSGMQLLVIGTDGADTITISQTGSSMIVIGGGGSNTYNGAFTSVVVYGFGGGDVIRLTNTVSAAGWVYAGDGDDVVYEAGAGAMTLYGGLGDDLLVTVGGGSDTLYGGEGTDSFWADTGDVIGDATSAETAARNVHRIERFYQPWTNNASSSDYVSLQIAGQDLRDSVITSAASGGYRNFASKPLFVDGARYDDIAQGSIGDCYLLAALASVADSDPGYIEQMIAPLGDGTFAVRFYRAGREVYLRLDGDLPIRSNGSLAYARFSDDGELWTPLLEKAYSFFRYDKNSYASLNGGWMTTVYEEMTNMAGGFLWVNQASDTVWQYMERALAGGHALSAGTYYNASGPIVGSHAYSVRSLEQTEDGQFVIVYNPWGVDGRAYDSNYSDGLLRLSMEQFQSYFQALATSAA